MSKKKKLIYSLGILMIVAIGFIGVSFALWTQNFTQSGENTIVSDCFQITLSEEKGILLENSFPMYDKDGKKLTPYTFQVRNECSRKVEYQLSFETTGNTTLNDSYVKFMFQNDEPVLLNSKESTKVTLSNGKNAYVLEKGYFEGNTTKDYSIRLWMDENITASNTDAMNKLFEGKITITASYLTKYYEEILNGTDPVLKDGLIPVTISNDGTVKKADITKEWYRYENQEWANAVILEDENMVYRDGQIIPESNIESYFVWIPRYKYQIFNEGNYTGKDGVSANYGLMKVVNVEFETKDVPKSNGSTVGSWLTHPAFTAFETNGMWVGKFETGYQGATSVAGAQQNPNNGTAGTPDKVIIKPNVYSWRNIQVANAYWTSYQYKRDYNSHMMKNTEWGAVAYLQQSKYGSGVYAGTSESTKASVRMNNNASYMTGYAAKKEPTCGFTNTNEECNKYETINTLGSDGSYTVNYFNSASQLASTTANYSGVYDMSGGSWEYVMGVMLHANGNPCSGRDATYNSGFNGPYCDKGQTLSLSNGVSDFPTDTRYYDTYAYSPVDEEYNRRILGDATGEMGPFTDRTYGSQVRQVSSWHDDDAWFVASAIPWFYRGGSRNHGTGAGVFYFANGYGNVGSGDSFRIVLSV